MFAHVIAYRLNGETTYALEGAIFIAGASVQWMRDMLLSVRDIRGCGPGPCSDSRRQAQAFFFVLTSSPQ